MIADETLEFRKVRENLFQACSENGYRYDLQLPKGNAKWELRMYMQVKNKSKLMRVHTLYETLLETKVALIYFMARLPTSTRIKLEIG